MVIYVNNLLHIFYIHKSETEPWYQLAVNTINRLNHFRLMKTKVCSFEQLLMMLAKSRISKVIKLNGYNSYCLSTL